MFMRYRSFPLPPSFLSLRQAQRHAIISWSPECHDGRPHRQLLHHSNNPSSSVGGNKGGGHDDSSAAADRRSLLTLAIETSCDDTCVAILEKENARAGHDGGSVRMLFHGKITSDNRRFGGIHPLVATESHMASVASLVQESLLSLPPAPSPTGESAVSRNALSIAVSNTTTGEGAAANNRSPAVSWRRRPDFVAATRGPGMASSLAAGLTLAKGLAVAWGVPLVGVNHMQAHALTPRLVSALERGKKGEGGETETVIAGRSNDSTQSHSPAFPFLTLLVSGGHTMLLRSTSLTSHTILAESPDVAIGDVLDKCARAILPPNLLPRQQPPPSVSAADDNAEAGEKEQRGKEEKGTKKGKAMLSYGPAFESFAFPNGPADFETSYNPPRRRCDEVAVVAPRRRRRPLPESAGVDSNPGNPRNLEVGGGEDDDGGLFYPWTIRPPLAESRAMRFDFSGINGQVRALVTRRSALAAQGAAAAACAASAVSSGPAVFDEEERRVMAVETMRVLFEHVASRIIFALQQEKDEVTASAAAAARKKKESGGVEPEPEPQPGPEMTRTLVVSGGVASNMFLRHVLRRTLDVRGFGRVELVVPPVELCTDNAAMIAWAGAEMYEAGWVTDLGVLPLKKWPLDPNEGGGIMGADGWVRR